MISAHPNKVKAYIPEAFRIGLLKRCFVPKLLFAEKTLRKAVYTYATGRKTKISLLQILKSDDYTFLYISSVNFTFQF